MTFLNPFGQSDKTGYLPFSQPLFVPVNRYLVNLIPAL